MKLLNSDFSDIWDDPSNPLDGGCFVSTSDSILQIAVFKLEMVPLVEVAILIIQFQNHWKR
ncbi:MAG: hypothetical protein IPK10_18490 [Bacteroidetes bacterium]|nr:hypothetical protein [Bacteroidota bacterium]